MMQGRSGALKFIGVCLGLAALAAALAFVTRSGWLAVAVVPCLLFALTGTYYLQSSETLAGHAAQRAEEVERKRAAADCVHCPKCGGAQVTGSRQGFGVGKAAIGLVAIGPVGLAGGLVNRGVVHVSCLACGHSWKAGTA